MPGVKDVAGNALSADSTWTFTTAAAANAPPNPTITSPTTGLLFRGGQVLTYAGTATDPNETLAASAYTWTVTRYDGTTPTVAAGRPSPARRPARSRCRRPGRPSRATTYYEIKLTVKDTGGLSASTTVQVKPRMANLSLASSPSGLQLSLDGVAQAAPLTRQTLSASSTRSPPHRRNCSRRRSTSSTGGRTAARPRTP